MKKVLLVFDQYGWGGHVRAQYIKKHLSDEFHVDIMDMNEFGEYEKRTNKNILTVDELKKFYVEKSTDKSIIDLKELNNFVSRNRSKINYDLIYFLFHTMLVGQKVKRTLEKDVKVITIVTGLPTIKPIFSNSRNFTTLASKCCAVGTNNYISLKDLKQYHKGKTFYAPRGVDPDVFYPLSKKHKPKHDKFVVGYVGKPVPEKGLNIIQEACNIAGVRLMTNTRNFTDALGHDDMREFYNKADVYVVASTIDGTPNPMLEAAACGKPIISNHIGNAPEFIKQGYNGYLIEKKHGRKINKYVYWLKHLEENRKKCFEMGLNARKEILKNWTWGKVTENERKIFREVLNG